MFISILELFKLGIGPSSSHTMGPMLAAKDFRQRIINVVKGRPQVADPLHVRCTLKGSLAYTGKGHATDHAVAFGLHGYTSEELSTLDTAIKLNEVLGRHKLETGQQATILFSPDKAIIFDKEGTLTDHPNGMIFELLNQSDEVIFSETYFSIGGGFITTLEEIRGRSKPEKETLVSSCPYDFDSADSMLKMAADTGHTIAEMKRKNEFFYHSESDLSLGIDKVWQAMCRCIKSGVTTQGVLPGGLKLMRRAGTLYDQLVEKPEECTLNDWLSAYAMAVNEENAAGHAVVTAPTNGAAGVIPAVLYYLVFHDGGDVDDVADFLLTAAAIGGLIKHRSSISGAEVGCQGEVGSAAAMAAAGLCAVKGGTARQIENAAEIALEHHLGMTCDPVLGLVQIPCIERNAFGAIKAYSAASLAKHGTGQHFMSLDNCIAAMKQTGQEMSEKYKETSLGGLAVRFTEC